MNKRFNDNGKLLTEFGKFRTIECPNCKKPIDYIPPRIVCIHCGFNKELKNQTMLYQSFPISSIELKDYLQASCCKNVLWAQNLNHLKFLEDYVRAELRERKPNINRSVISQLPKWIKDAKNRTEILKTIKVLKMKLKSNGYTKNST
ncbi:hypothetical protein I5168_09490 [Nonlabens sp. SCSIO 43208]|uniref:hypothetical protein n=1 Tax=Nonlabens sp. SCSIO 43208 TaxID=2793009 RepID=UPI003D6C1EE3